MNDEHLQVSEIALFRKGSLSKEEARQASRHLLICSDCRILLPKPSRNEFLDSVLIEQDNSIFNIEGNDSIGSKFFTLLSNFRPMLQPAFAALMLVAITTGLSLWFLSNPNNSTSSDLVASVDTGEVSAHDHIIPMPQLDNDPPAIPMRRDNRTGRPTTATVPTNQGQAHKGVNSKSGLSQKSKLNRPIASETRNVDDLCSSVESISLDTSAFDDGVKLNWNKVSNAATYGIYISDLNEKLVDHFETEKETSYVSKAQFEPNVIYKWRLVITLRSGETISGESQRFSLNDLSGNKSVQRNLRLQDRSSLNIRCKEKN